MEKCRSATRGRYQGRGSPRCWIANGWVFSDGYVKIRWITEKCRLTDRSAVMRIGGRPRSLWPQQVKTARLPSNTNAVPTGEDRAVASNLTARTVDLSVVNRAVNAPQPAAPQSAATVGVKAVKKKSKLRLDVKPDQRSWNYNVVIQKKSGGKWKTVKVTTTNGSTDRLTIKLGKGKYRVKVSNPARSHRCTQRGRATQTVTNRSESPSSSWAGISYVLEKS